MNIFFKTIKHFHLVNKHRWFVFCYSVKAGIPFRGLVHDLSKYSPTEFWESVKYYDGKRSPIYFAKLEKGYSNAWLHHKGRNKHHYEYWEDADREKRYSRFMPYKYAVECICDKLAAGRAYNGKKFNKKQPLEYWERVDKKSIIAIHPGTLEFIELALTKISKDGINNTLKRKKLKKIYNTVKEKYEG